MGMTANDLAAQRDAMRGEASPDRTVGGKRTERVLKWFTPEEKINIIKATEAKVTVGSGDESREVKIKPLNPRQFVEAYVLLKQVLMPIVDLYKPGQPAPPVTALVDALGENVDKLPKLLTLILKRGNEISEDWINENLDMFLDLQTILPKFIEQNGLLHLFAGNAELPEDAPGKDEVAQNVNGTGQVDPPTQD